MLFSNTPGGLPPIRSDIALGVAASLEFASKRDVPDVLGFRDYAADTSLTFSLLEGRIAAGSLFDHHQLFPLPKGNGRGFRSLTVLEPLDEFALRSYVGRCSQAIVGATMESHVLNGLIRHPGPGWFSADFRDQIRRRRELQRTYYDHPDTAAVGFYDVKEFFRNCRHEDLHHLLLGAGAPVGAASTLVGMLGMVFGSGCGLPIGFEGSGPLANLFLGPVDRALLALGLPFVRWTDDIDVFLRSIEQRAEVADAVASQLDVVHLALNLSKVDVIEKGVRAEERLLDPGRDSLFDDEAIATSLCGSTNCKAFRSLAATSLCPRHTFAPTSASFGRNDRPPP